MRRPPRRRRVHAPRQDASDRARSARAPGRDLAAHPSVPLTLMIDRSDTQWYRDALFYQLHVKSFFDANDDGIGDFEGVTRKLDYVKDLGVTAIWVMPFYPSPLRDDGYDIADYRGINPGYGTMRDFRRFVRAAHERGLRVVDRARHQPHLGPASLVPEGAALAVRAPPRASSTSGPTPTRSTRTPGSSSSTRRLRTGPGIPVAQAYFWHRFYSPTSPISTSTIRACSRPCSRPWLIGSTWASTACGSTPSPI